MDTAQQAKAICNDGASATALQQQLAEMKSKASGLENFIRTGMHSRASPCFPELTSMQVPTSSTAGTAVCI